MFFASYILAIKDIVNECMKYFIVEERMNINNFLDFEDFTVIKDVMLTYILVKFRYFSIIILLLNILNMCLIYTLTIYN